MVKKRVLLLSSALLLLCFDMARGCVCGEKPSVAQAMRESTAVFSGKVVAKLKYGVRFKVKRSWKGISSSYIYVYTGNAKNDCDPRFEKGETWLIYAANVPLYRTESAVVPYSTRLMARGCGRTAKLPSAEEDLKELEVRSSPP